MTTCSGGVYVSGVSGVSGVMREFDERQRPGHARSETKGTKDTEKSRKRPPPERARTSPRKFRGTGTKAMRATRALIPPVRLHWAIAHDSADGLLCHMSKADGAQHAPLHTQHCIQRTLCLRTMPPQTNQYRLCLHGRLPVGQVCNRKPDHKISVGFYSRDGGSTGSSSCCCRCSCSCSSCSRSSSTKY